MMSRALVLAVLLAADATPGGDLFRAQSARHIGTIQVGAVPISAMAYTRDGRRLVVLGSDGAMSIWDLSARRALRKFPGKTFHSDFSMSADGTRVLGPSPDRTSFRLMDLERGVDVRSFTDVQPVNLHSCALSPDGRRVALFKRTRSVALVDVKTGDEGKTLLDPLAGAGGFLAWSPDGKLLAVHAGDGTVRVIDAASGDQRGSFRSPGRLPPFLGFTRDSAHFVHITQDGRIKLYDKTAQEVRTIDEGFEGARLVSFSPDGRIMAAGALDGRVRLWDTTSWKELREFDAGPITELAFSPDGRYLAFGSSDGAVRFWGGSGGGRTGPGPAAKGDKPRASAPGYLGIQATDASKGDDPAEIGSVLPNTAAEKAGLKAGDVILKIGATKTPSFDSLREAVMAMKEGDEIEITYRRGAAEKKVKVKLGARPPDDE